jgi:molybdate transport system regulatory protein
MAKRIRSTTDRINKTFAKGKLSANGSLWIEINGARIFGPGPVELLEYISETGSINQAARKMDMSYKKAWEIIARLNKNAASPLVITSQGGKQGGGSSVSKEAEELIAYYQQLRQRFQDFLDKETAGMK